MGGGKKWLYIFTKKKNSPTNEYIGWTMLRELKGGAENLCMNYRKTFIVFFFLFVARFQLCIYDVLAAC